MTMEISGAAPEGPRTYQCCWRWNDDGSAVLDPFAVAYRQRMAAPPTETSK
jgi:hypothetical protein